MFKTGIFLLCVLITTPSFAQIISEDENIISREQTLFILRNIDPSNAQYALASPFRFPESTRYGSRFGIDVSHYTQRNCNCIFSWSDLAKIKVDFVYAKATQGAHFVDPSFFDYQQEVRKSEGRVRFGAYHFLTPYDDVDLQIERFLNVTGARANDDLAPSLDLEWIPGPLDPKCPANAVIPVRNSSGVIVHKCDQWSGLTGSEILEKVNRWIDGVFDETGRKPLLYTNASWWKTRVGEGGRLEELHTSDIWVADYSKSGRATETPRTPGSNPWKAWQFTDRSIITVDGKEYAVDANIEHGDVH